MKKIKNKRKQYDIEKFSNKLLPVLDNVMTIHFGGECKFDKIFVIKRGRKI